jgi:heptosyltransferase-2
MKPILVKTDCKHLNGDVPCKPHKEHGVRCDTCPYYLPRDKRILIIKLDGIGDVIRTTPVLRKLKEMYPNCEITWLTFYPEVLPHLVEKKLIFNHAAMIQLLADEFDYVYNFDKRIEACALTKMINAKIKKGFTLKDGRCAPIDSDAEHKYLTGLFDDVSKANKKTYVEEIFEIAGLPYKREKYLMNTPANTRMFPKLKSPVIGLNTGSSEKWLDTRSWPEENWIELALALQAKGYSVVLLGGELEHEKNLRIAAKSAAHYFGHFPLKEFMALVAACDVVVTTVTSTMHIVIGLEKKIVLFVNIFPKAEFELYGLGEIVEPETPCQCYFKSKCHVYPGSSCMKNITVEKVIAATEKTLEH